MLAKAGQIALVGDEGQDAPLNPFTISLCAIFAGMAADQAYKAMIGRARKLFAPGDAGHARQGQGG